MTQTYLATRRAPASVAMVRDEPGGLAMGPELANALRTIRVTGQCLTWAQRPSRRLRRPSWCSTATWHPARQPG